MFKVQKHPMYQLWEVDTLTGELVNFLGFGGSWEFCFTKRRALMKDALYRPLVVIVPEELIYNTAKGLVK